MTTPQQPEQAETPVVGEVMPDWMRREVDCGRKSKIAGPRTRALLWLADALAASQARAEAAEADSRRLDWLDGRAFTAYRARDYETRSLEGHAVVVDEDRPGSRRGNVHDTLRAAIDAAMEGGK